MVAQDGPDRWRLVLLALPSAGRCRPGDNRGSEDITETHYGGGGTRPRATASHGGGKLSAMGADPGA